MVAGALRARRGGERAQRAHVAQRAAAPAAVDRRALPDLIRPNGGGANAVLVRGTAVREHRRATLRRVPERRVVHTVRPADGAWVANLHAQVRPPQAARADIAEAGREALGWAAGAPLLLGGDLDVQDPAVEGLEYRAGAAWTTSSAAGGAP